jgi:glycosyltransferase involved in cell wall biosynthesis
MNGLSLIIATYNRGALIADTLESVRCQETLPDEVIVVDDGSTDDTADFVAKNFPEVRVVRKPNGGTSSARNVGANAASGPWLIFLDHDDLLLPNAIKALVDLAERFPEAVSLHADHIYENLANGERLENHHHTIPAFKRLLDTQVHRKQGNSRLYGFPLYRSLLRGNLLQQPFAVRKEAFDRLGGYSEDIRYCEDWDLYLRLTQKYPVAVSDDVISVHVIEGQNLHLTEAHKQRVMYERVLRCRLASHQWLDWTNNKIVREKLAAQEKMIGDDAYVEGNLSQAYLAYLKSCTWLPSDLVVMARLVLRLPSALRHRLNWSKCYRR